MKVSKFRVHTRGLGLVVMRTVKAVVAYAEQHKEQRAHYMDLSEFRKLAGLPSDMTSSQIVEVMARADKAIASLRVVEVSGRNKNLLLTGSWPVFDCIFIAHTHISFEICPKMWTWESLAEPLRTRNSTQAPLHQQ
jgi:hypothetical protein